MEQKTTKPQSEQPQVQKTTRKILKSPFYGYGRYVWAIYPDYWPESWGKAPLFGYVSADDRFIAERVAYDTGLVYRNDTFKPKAVKSLASKPIGATGNKPVKTTATQE